MTMQQLTVAAAAMTALADAYNTKMGQINQAVNTAAQQVGDTFRQFYVNSETGSDTASGSSAAPLKSIEQAITRSVWAGRTRVFLQSNVELTTQINVRVSALDFDLQGHTLSFAPVAGSSGDRTAAFVIGDGGPSAIVRVRNGSLRLRNMPDGMPNFRGVFRGFYTPFFLSLTDLTVLLDPANEAEASQAQRLVSPSYPVFLHTVAISFPEAMAGRWILGVPAGTLPSDDSRVAYTNLPSL